MKRGVDDQEWQAVKRRVRLRDKTCRLLPIITAKEYLMLRQNATHGLDTLDPAHVMGVGAYPHMVYLDENIVMLNRFSHDCLDNCRSPVTGKPITRQERDGWWQRIVGTEPYQHLLVVATRRECDEHNNG